MFCLWLASKFLGKARMVLSLDRPAKSCPKKGQQGSVQDSTLRFCPNICLQNKRHETGQKVFFLLKTDQQDFVWWHSKVLPSHKGKPSHKQSARVWALSKFANGLDTKCFWTHLSNFYLVKSNQFSKQCNYTRVGEVSSCTYLFQIYISAIEIWLLSSSKTVLCDELSFPLDNMSKLK